MTTKDYYELSDMVCKEIEDIKRKGKLSGTDVEYLEKLTTIDKNIKKAIMFEDGGYSQGGDWRADMYGTYGNSYRGRDSMGRYVRDGGSSNGYNGYSREGDMVDKLTRMLGEAKDNRERDMLQDCIDKMRR